MYKKIMSILNNPNLGLLLIRIALGSVFIAHGWAKFGDLNSTVIFFVSLGLAPIVAYLVTAIELIGGVLMVFGVSTRIVGLAFVAVMIGAISTVKIDRGFMGGYEFELTLLLVSLAMAFLGGGKFRAWRSCDC